MGEGFSLTDALKASLHPLFLHLLPQGYSRELFQFEEDRFDNVPALIRYYVGGRRPISQASGAVIFHPITRTLPLRIITERQAEQKSSSSSRAARGEKQAENDKRRSFSSAHSDTLQVANPLLRWEQVLRSAHAQLNV